MWLCEFIFNQAKLSGGGPTECILLLCIHKALLVLEQNSSFVLSELVMTSYSSPRPRRKSVHIFTMFFCSMFLNPSRDLEIFPQTSQEWEMLLDRVPVSVSEWLFGSFVLILRRVPWPPWEGVQKLWQPSKCDCYHLLQMLSSRSPLVYV